jgi:diaminopimelate decarboxylase
MSCARRHTYACLQVVGVSFHVGSGCQDVSVYSEAIKHARRWGLAAAGSTCVTATLFYVAGGRGKR